MSSPTGLFAIVALTVLSITTSLVAGQLRQASNNKWEVQCRNRNNQPICQGALVQSNAILVPARCVQGLSPADITIIAGITVSIGGSGQIRNCRQIIRHENWSSGGLVNDVAILVLDIEVQLNINTQIVQLPPPGWTVPRGQQAICSGWGVFGLLGAILNLVLSLLAEVVVIVVGGTGGCAPGCVCCQTCIGGLGSSLVGLVDGVLVLIGQLIVPGGSCRGLATFSSIVNLQAWLSINLP